MTTATRTRRPPWARIDREAAWLAATVSVLALLRKASAFELTEDQVDGLIRHETMYRVSEQVATVPTEENAEMIINHEISGSNFHGRFRIVLRGPADGFRLTEGQVKRLLKALCGVRGCQCSPLWNGKLDPTSARLEADETGIFLVPHSG